MFTGIIEEIGQIKSVRRGSRSIVIDVEGKKVLQDLKVGDSIATNGICLTVTAFTATCFSADVMPETMSRTNLGNLRSGDRVNLERALCLNSRLGGHIVSGHIDGVGRITAKEQDENAIWITIGASPEVLRYVIEKGSIAIDGISLTVAYVDDAIFKVSVIPHTQGETTLTAKQIGENVNLENDLIAKYVEKLTGATQGRKGLSLDFLQANGF